MVERLSSGKKRYFCAKSSVLNNRIKNKRRRTYQFAIAMNTFNVMTMHNPFGNFFFLPFRHRNSETESGNNILRYREKLENFIIHFGPLELNGL